MLSNRRHVIRLVAVCAAGMLPAASGCTSVGHRAKLVQQNEELRRSSDRLGRLVAQRDATIATLQQQTEHVRGFGPDRPADLFSPVRIEIAKLSGGADYNDAPGDDGVTVYLQPRDRDGDAVKVPGRITIQLLDNTDLATPRVVGVYEFSDPDELRANWYGKFGTMHYSLKCPFPPGAALPASRRLTVSARFVDFLTGATLTATKEVAFAASDG